MVLKMFAVKDLETQKGISKDRNPMSGYL